MPTIALVYCRVSSERQKKEGQGLDSQEHRCRDYASRKGYVVEKVFQDSFTGGGNFMERPAMKALLAYVDEHAKQDYVVIFDDLKRFARDTLFHWSLRRAFRARRITPECLNFNFEDTPEGEFIETILAAQGELERKQNRRQVIQKQRARLERGYWPFFPPPGYTTRRDPTHGKLLVPNEPRAGLIREAFLGYAHGRLDAQKDVLDFLQAGGFFAARRSGLGYIEDVTRLLTRVIYAGFIEYRPWQVSRRPGHHEALITSQTYELVQAKLLRTERLLSRRDTSADFRLRRFVVCAQCRRPYTAAWTTKRAGAYRVGYYRCATRGCTEGNRSVRADVLHTHFLELLQTIQPAPHTLKLFETELLRHWNRRLAKLQLEDAASEMELRAVRDDILQIAERAKRVKDERVVTIYEDQLARLAQREASLTAQVSRPATEGVSFETALSQVCEHLSNPYKTWVDGDVKDRALLLKIIFEGLLAYDRHSGFETAELSLPLRVCDYFATSQSHGVEMVLKSWNRLEQVIFELNCALVDRETDKKRSDSEGQAHPRAA